MNKENFGILGYGYVGRATHESILKNLPCAVHDKKFSTTVKIFKDVSTVFVCIPTSVDNDIDIIIDEIKQIKKINPKSSFVIRSTLPLGQSERIQQETGEEIIYIPEFLRERFWDTDCHRRPLIVGYDGKTLPEWLAAEEIIQCSTKEAELVKMFSNNFAVMRIAFANAFCDLSKGVGADYNLVKNMFLTVQQNQSYLDIPGHDGTRGFGGKCLPKDLEFLINTLDKMGLEQYSWFKEIKDLNENWRNDVLK